MSPPLEHSSTDNQIIEPLDDRIYRYRYVIPSGVGITSARPPRDGYVLQTSNSVTGSSDVEVLIKYNPGSVTMANLGEIRNFSFIREMQL